jgi:hypothetical protein
MLISPLAVALLSWLWVRQMAAMDHPGVVLVVLSVLALVATALMAGVEASRIGIGRSDDVDENGNHYHGPPAWFLFVLLAWLVGYPAYLFRRSRYGLKNLGVLGILASLAFCVSLLLVGISIDTRSKGILDDQVTLADYLKDGEDSARCLRNLREIDRAKGEFARRQSRRTGDAVDVADISVYIEEGFSSLRCPLKGEYSINRLGEPPSCSVPTHSLAVVRDVPAPATVSTNRDHDVQIQARMYRRELQSQGQGTFFTDDDCYYLIKATHAIFDKGTAEAFLSSVAVREHVHGRRVSLVFLNGRAGDQVALGAWLKGLSTDFKEKCTRVYRKMLELGWVRREPRDDRAATP